jgi:NADH-quinone oxidoreductase subunit N
MQVFIEFYFLFSFYFICFGLLSIVVGSIYALHEVNFKRFLAYSGIVHMGYIIISISSGDALSLFAPFYYLVIYLFGVLNIFSIFLVVKNKHNDSSITNIFDLGSVLQSNKKICRC